jgi:hypothetical protein
MAVPNAMVLDAIKEAIAASVSMGGSFTAAMEKQAISFQTAIDRFIDADRSNHVEFRAAVSDLTTCVKVLQERQSQQQREIERHDRNWVKFWGIIVAVVIIPIGTAIVALVTK